MKIARAFTARERWWLEGELLKDGSRWQGEGTRHLADFRLLKVGSLAFRLNDCFPFAIVVTDSRFLRVFEGERKRSDD